MDFGKVESPRQLGFHSKCMWRILPKWEKLESSWKSLAQSLKAGDLHMRYTAEILIVTVMACTPAFAQSGPNNSFIVDMNVTVTSSNPPLISGTSNLPNGTRLIVDMIGDPPSCAPRCGFGFRFASVNNGRFTIGLDLTGPAPLVPDSYTINIDMMASVQDPNAQSIMGQKGENLRGPFVFTHEDGGVYVPAKLPRNPNPSESEKVFGRMIHVTQRISITPDGRAFTIPSAPGSGSAIEKNRKASDICRTGVASTSREACAAAEQEIVAAEHIQARASPTLLQYEATMMPIQRAVQIAFFLQEFVALEAMHMFNRSLIPHQLSRSKKLIVCIFLLLKCRRQTPRQSVYCVKNATMLVRNYLLIKPVESWPSVQSWKPSMIFKES